MSQHIHRCNNNIHLNGEQCDSCISRQQKKGKVDRNKSAHSQDRVRERSKSCNRNATHTNQVPNNSTTVNKKKALVVRTPKCDGLKTGNTATNATNKGLYLNNRSILELAMKTKNSNRRSRSSSKSRESWGKMLTKGMITKCESMFNGFDPLRTLHFIANELKYKLLEQIPSDKTILQLLSDMEHTLDRIPPDISSKMILHLPKEDVLKKYAGGNLKPKSMLCLDDNIEVVQGRVEKIDEEFHAPLVEIGVQTNKTKYIEPERLHKHLEESSVKINEACKQMEIVCSRLKSEKEELEVLLKEERKTVASLRNQIIESEKEKSNSVNAIIASLQEEKEMLQLTIKKLKAQIESEQTPSAQELRTLIQELRKQKLDGDEQITILNHQVTLVNMEKEKYVALLAARERQIKEMHTEMNDLQEAVQIQLTELQNAPNLSILSSITNMSNEPFVMWVPEKSKNDEENSIASSPVNDCNTKQLFLKRDIKEGLTAASSNSTINAPRFRNESKRNSLKKLKHRQSSCTRKGSSHGETPSKQTTTEYSSHTDTCADIKNMFAQIKQQALLVTSSFSIPEQQKN